MERLFDIFSGKWSSKKRPRSDSTEDVQLCSLTISQEQIQNKKTITSKCETIHVETERNCESNVNDNNIEAVEERVTLAQLFAKITPDADINSPHVVVVGSQTAGKTKLIISLVFFHLIDNEHFTDDMGEQLLKIFRTGTRMVTRRPTTINLSKSSTCKMTINLGGDTAVYPDAQFFEIIRHIFDQSADAAGHAYEEELRVYISAPGLPNRTFTDLPGLITNDRQLTTGGKGAQNSSPKSIATLVAQYMQNPSTTVVVVEPASVEDFETSQISPLLREIRLHNRPDIFENSVLVLSKCDKIRNGLEGDIVDKIDLSSAQLLQFPYRYVVGVINQMEGEAEIFSGQGGFSAFKQMFRATREFERQRFEAFRNRDGSPLSVTTQCTTSAVFNQMEQISFNMVYKSIQDGLQSLDAKIAEVEREVRATLAPPIEFYDNHQQTTHQQQQQQERTETNSTYQPSRMTFIEKFGENFGVSVLTALDDIPLLHRHDKLTLISEAIGSDWPPHSVTDISVANHYKRAFDAIELHHFKMAEGEICSRIDGILAHNGCLSRAASPFHRVDRFPALCRRIQDFVMQRLKEVMKHAKVRISNYLSYQWDFVAPSGISKDQLCSIFDALHNIAICSVHRGMTEALSDKMCFGLEDGLFVESEPFRAQRALLQDRPFALRRQRAVLTVCLGVTSNDELRDALELSCKTLANDVNDMDKNSFWAEFWLTAADLANPISSTLPTPSQTNLRGNSCVLNSFDTAMEQEGEKKEEELKEVKEMTKEEVVVVEEEEEEEEEEKLPKESTLPLTPPRPQPTNKKDAHSLSFIVPSIQQRVRPYCSPKDHKSLALHFIEEDEEKGLGSDEDGSGGYSPPATIHVACVRRKTPQAASPTGAVLKKTSSSSSHVSPRSEGNKLKVVEEANKSGSSSRSRTRQAAGTVVLSSLRPPFTARHAHDDLDDGGFEIADYPTKRARLSRGERRNLVDLTQSSDEEEEENY